MKPFLIIGVGSSGCRFATILQHLKQPVVFYRHRPDLVIPAGFQSVDSLQNLPQYQAVIISSSTASHLFYLKKFIQAGLPCLVDKPLARTTTGLSTLIKQAQDQGLIIQVGFNLRFLPIVQHIKKILEAKKLGQIYHAELYVGQYLPQWRPTKDYRQTYSANFTKGGGAALDLIHEIDLAYHFFPDINLQPVISDKVSHLDIDVEDLVMLKTNEPPYVIVKLDYLNHRRTRRYLIVGEQGTIDCDIINHQFNLTLNDGSSKKITAVPQFDIMSTYELEIKNFLKLVQTHTEPLLTNRSLGVDALKSALKVRKHVPRS